MVSDSGLSCSTEGFSSVSSGDRFAVMGGSSAGIFHSHDQNSTFLPGNCFCLYQLHRVSSVLTNEIEWLSSADGSNTQDT